LFIALMYSLGYTQPNASRPGFLNAIEL